MLNADMKSKSQGYIILFSSGLGLLFFLLAHSGAGQDTTFDADSGPTKGDAIPPSSMNQKPPKSGEIDNGETNIDNSTVEDTKRVYDKNGTSPTPSVNPYGAGEPRDRINFGKLKERVVKTESKSERIRKTEDGSSDATEPTGAFKGSLLDMRLPVSRTSSAPARVLPSATPNRFLKPSENATPALESTPAPPGPPGELEPSSSAKVDLSLSLKPEPSATATPQQ